jgi:hypothetical protein
MPFYDWSLSTILIVFNMYPKHVCISILFFSYLHIVEKFVILYMYVGYLIKYLFEHYIIKLCNKKKGCDNVTTTTTLITLDKCGEH